jgi:hypothetical protein
VRPLGLDPDQLRLLRAVKDGKVARHRLGRGQSPACGDDYEEIPGRGPGGLARAKLRIQPLRRLGLVDLEVADPTVEKWLWRVTAAGGEVLEQLVDQERAAEDDVDNPRLTTAGQLAAAIRRIDLLESVLGRILVTYTQPPAPGQEALRVSYVEKKAVDQWRSVLGTKEVS